MDIHENSPIEGRPQITSDVENILRYISKNDDDDDENNVGDV